jgi:preprotein translocase subunit YajC
MAKSKTKEHKYKEEIIKRLNIGDKVLSASGKHLTASLVVHKQNRTIILFDGDMEVDFDPYVRVKVLQGIE